MTENKKYFGMTVTQIGVLVGLGALAFLLFCVTGWLIIGRGLGFSKTAQLPVVPTLSQPTATLIVTPTQTSTPAPSPVPYETLIPSGWTQYRTALYEVWMLPGYKSTKILDVLVTGLGGQPIVNMALKGAYSSKSANKIYMAISYEPLNTDTFENFINQHLQALGLVPSERSKVMLNSAPAVRLVFSGRKGSNTDFNELTYIFLDGTTVWYVQYTAEINDYFNSLSSFEASAKTFRMVK